MIDLSEKSYGIRHNGITVSVQKWASHKLPVLAVKIEDENCLYKVASFNSIESANWFIELMQEFFAGLTQTGEGHNGNAES